MPDASEMVGLHVFNGGEMSYSKMIEALENAFNSNVQKIRRKGVFGDAGEKLNVPVLSGPTGIGKTASVKEFTKNKGFSLISIDCSYEPANFLVIHLNNAINDINNGNADGCLLLLDNINEASGEFLDLINQYRENSLNAFMEVAVPGDKGKPMQQKKEVTHDKLPENLFIVGEQRDS